MNCRLSYSEKNEIDGKYRENLYLLISLQLASHVIRSMEVFGSSEQCETVLIVITFPESVGNSCPKPEQVPATIERPILTSIGRVLMPHAVAVTLFSMTNVFCHCYSSHFCISLA